VEGVVANTLILTVGLPRSGKSTWARRQGVPVVCPDAIRLALHGQRFQALAEPLVWAIARVMVRALFLAGHGRVVVDATHVTRKRRDFWLADGGEQWAVLHVPFPADREECVRRARAMGDEEIIPVIERMAAEFEPL
jgi:predicted kinase